MSDINVLALTQKIIVNAATSSVSVINAGPQGPAGPAGSGSGDVTQAELDAVEAAKVSKSGDTMTGALTLSGPPTVNLHAATKAYVDENVMSGGASVSYVDSQDATKVSKAGDTMTGLLTLSGPPTATLHAATKAYVDANAGGGAVSSVNTKTGAVVLNPDDLNDSATAKKFVSAAQITKINNSVEGVGITKVQSITQAAYDALGTPDSTTLYVING